VFLVELLIDKLNSLMVAYVVSCRICWFVMDLFSAFYGVVCDGFIFGSFFVVVFDGFIPAFYGVVSDII
jgi:hypothetical protein